MRVTLFEKEAKPGGHTNTVQVMDRLGTMIPVDTGFMVFNDPTYPNLNRLFNQLGVTSTETDMSFGVHDSRNGYYYASSGLSGFFAQKRNLLSPSHWNMIRGILKFFKTANACPATPKRLIRNADTIRFFQTTPPPRKGSNGFHLPDGLGDLVDASFTHHGLPRQVTLPFHGKPWPVGSGYPISVEDDHRRQSANTATS